MEEEILIKYFEGNTTTQEETELLDWIESNEANRKTYFEYRKAWDAYLLHRDSVEPAISFSRLLRKNDLKAEKKPSRSSVWNSRLREWVKIVAVFILAFGSFWYLYPYFHKPNPSYNQIEVPSGQRVKLTLPDGSLVWLNAQSKFTYPAVFDKHARNVTLNGEGLFEIVHNPKQPFRVQTPAYTVEVTGTRFDVYAYGNSNSFETTLIDGSVIVSDSVRRYSLKPGYQLIFNLISQQMESRKVNPNDYISWKDGYYFFNDITFEEMSKRLGHYCNTQIIINDPAVLTYKGTGKFRQDESITQIMDVVKSDMPFKYKYNKDTNKLLIEKIKK
jgi:ferric-dicitrate binding protein FerR (iron transport regulator)